MREAFSTHKTTQAVRARRGGPIRAFVSRLHFYAGLFVGPFIFVAALTGTLYVLTPQIEALLYRDVLQTRSQALSRPLAEQVDAAKRHLATDDMPRIVRPAPHPGDTTRVMFASRNLGASEYRTVFVDPADLRIAGDLVTYGTSGILPFRTFLDYLHRNLLLGEIGRAYSELAASWLWVLALGGLCLFAWRKTGQMHRRKPEHAGLRLRHRHGVLGIGLMAGLLFISATGLTWSQWAGERITDARNAVGWVTPPLNVDLAPGSDATGAEGHAHHHGSAGDMSSMGLASKTLRNVDEVLLTARSLGIDTAKVEVVYPTPGKAWAVREYDRSWPTQVDAVALDPDTLAVVSKVDFASFPIVAKLIRWGIDAHMGVLFGVANQLVLAVFGAALCVSVVYGYRIWWSQRPPAGAFPQTLTLAWLQLSTLAKAFCLFSAIAIGWTLPLLGLSLLAFLVVDLIRWRYGSSNSPMSKQTRPVVSAKANP